MSSQDSEPGVTIDGGEGEQRSDKNTVAEIDLFQAIKNKDCDRLLHIIRSQPALNLNCVDKDELSPLQHACHIGDIEIVRTLINNGAHVNFTQRKDGYTPLMFAAISAKTAIVRLLLERGVDVTAENCVHRTATQMAAFVGQFKVVSIITNWVSYQSSIEPYTKRRQLEEEPRIQTRQLAHVLHDFVVFPSFHPIKFMLHIKENSDLVKHATQFIYVLDDLCSKSIKPPLNDESLSLKYHYLSYILQNSRKAYDARMEEIGQSGAMFAHEICSKALEIYIRRFIKRAKPRDLQPLTPMINRFIAECLYKYPYTQLAIYKTSTFALSKGDSGDLNAYSVLTQSLNGPRMFGHTAESCSICLDLNKNKKCSKCKVVYYCGPSCQQIDWFQHKKVCRSPEETPLLEAVADGGS